MKKKLIALTLCVAFLITGCNAATTKKLLKTAKNAADLANSSTATTAPTATPAPKQTNVKIGKRAKISDWSFKVTKVSVKKKIKNGQYRVFKPKKGNQFVIINISVTNKGKKEATFLPRVGYENKALTAKLYYKDEYEYSATQLLSYDKDIVTKSISPLDTKKGIIAFEVPKKVAKSKKNLKLKIGTSLESVVYSAK